MCITIFCYDYRHYKSSLRDRPARGAKPVFGEWNTVIPLYNGPLYSGHQTTCQKFQFPFIFCKVDLYIAVTLPFPKGDHCTPVRLYISVSLYSEVPKCRSAEVHTYQCSLSFCHCRVVLESLAVSMATTHNCSSFVFVVCDFGLVWGDILQ